VKEPRLIGDSMKLKQVLVNILGNAAKFTDKGSITLTVTQEKKQNSNMTFVRFSVKDTGIGISEENLSRIFNSFEQAENSTARKYGGTGLGLSISSSYVSLMGGKLEVSSSLGKGSEFYFTLPMRKASPSEIPAESSKSVKTVDFSTKTVLLAEDDELNMEIARTLLEADGLTVETAENGQQAADMFNASELNHYDAVLMDIRMPVMDGLEAAKLIRRSERADASSVPIIAMTANAFDEDMKKSVECGMNGHLSKPIDMNRIREVLSEIWSK
ncbi:MAG: response regulator, partial [Oscillospiraceae bacterium]|nr:response regulator [Oscillospiraceae bacterium]